MRFAQYVNTETDGHFKIIQIINVTLELAASILFQFMKGDAKWMYLNKLTMTAEDQAGHV